MSTVCSFSLLAAPAFLSVACDEVSDAKKNDPKEEGAKSTAAGEPGSASTPDALIAKERIKTKAICAEVLAPKDVADVTGLDVADLELLAHGHGLCNVGSGSSPFRISFGVSFVRDTTESAELHFANATKNRTKEEIQAQLDLIAAKAAERNPDKKAGVETVVGATRPSMPTISYTDVEGVGDEARLSEQTSDFKGKKTTEYGLMIRVRNAAVSLSVSGESLDATQTQDALKKLGASVAHKVAAL